MANCDRISWFEEMYHIVESDEWSMLVTLYDSQDFSNLFARPSIAVAE